MAARENQGLQIALIVFAMLVITLSVTTYVFWKKQTEAIEKAKEAENLARRNDAEGQAAKNEIGEVKKLICGNPTEKLETLKKAYEQHMQVLGAANQPGASYWVVHGALLTAIRAQNDKIIAHDVRARAAEAQVTEISAKGVSEIAKYEKERTAASEELVAEREKFNADRVRVTKENETLVARVETQRKETEKKEDTLNTQVKTVIQRASDLEREKGILRTKVDSLESPDRETFDGTVTSVDFPQKTVYIALGQADGLKKQVTFRVYDRSFTSVGTAKPKASIEVLRIIDDHLSEARIVTDDIKNPILKGDKISSPAWHPGLKVHFAVAGFIDLDDDGRSDRQLVRAAILQSDGVIDAEIGEDGKRTGTMSVNTQYLVVGARPTENTNEAARNAYTALLNESTRFGVKQISAQTLLNQMGYEGAARTISLGKGLTSSDFKGKQKEGVVRESTGNSAFRERTPPPPGGN